MKLATGTRLGPYEILTLLGAGGIGEVYRARDSRLERSVAIKVRPRTILMRLHCPPETKTARRHPRTTAHGPRGEPYDG
jgi:hypothetical protein